MTNILRVVLHTGNFYFKWHAYIIVVLDDSFERRGFLSINALWKNKIAVLVGDYLLSKGLLLSIEAGDFNHLHILSNAVKEMSEGELLQIEKARKLNVSEDIYFEIIRG